MKVCFRHGKAVSCIVEIMPSPTGLIRKYTCPVCEKIFERKVIVEKFKINGNLHFT